MKLASATPAGGLHLAGSALCRPLFNWQNHQAGERLRGVRRGSVLRAFTCAGVGWGSRLPQPGSGSTPGGCWPTPGPEPWLSALAPALRAGLSLLLSRCTSAHAPALPAHSLSYF